MDVLRIDTRPSCKRSAIQANAAAQDGVRQQRAIILDLVRTIHGDFAHADDIHAEDVVPLHDGDGRSAIGVHAGTLKTYGTAHDLNARVAVVSDDIATDKDGGAGIQNVEALSVALKQIASGSADVRQEGCAPTGLEESGTAVIFDIEGAEVHAKEAAIDIDTISAVVEDTNLLVGTGSDGYVRARADGHARAAIVLKAAAFDDHS